MRRGAERHRGHGALHHERRSARRVCRRLRHRPSRDALHVSRPENHRESQCHHDQRARKDPVGESDAHDRRLRQQRHRGKRRGIHGERLPEHPRAAEQHGRHGVHAAAARDGLELTDDVAGVLRPVARLLGQAAHHQRGECGGSVRAKLGNRLRRLAHVGREHALWRPSGKDCVPREQLVRRRAQRVDVGAVVHLRVAGRLLRRHVRRRADGRADLREGRAGHRRPRGADGLGDAEIEHDGGAAREHHVVWLDVAMHHAPLVCIRERLRHVAQDADDFGDRERAAPDMHAQGLAFHERHGVEGEPVGLTCREHRDDVRLLQGGGGPDFALEPVHAQSLRQFRRQHLDDDLAAEAQFFREEDAAHAAPAELALQAVCVAERLLKLGLQVGSQAGVSGRESRGPRRRYGRAGQAARRGLRLRATTIACACLVRPASQITRPLQRTVLRSGISFRVRHGSRGAKRAMPRERLRRQRGIRMGSQWAIEELNLGPHAYQACALTT